MPPVLADLPLREAAVYEALVRAGGRVVGRTELARASGLAGLSPRRVDAVLVALRRRLGPDAVVTVRGRGWMLAPGRAAAVHEVGTDRKHEGLHAETPAS